MTKLKLETFQVDSSAGPSLQNIRSEVLEREKNEAYASGFKDGVNVTKDAVNAEQNRLLSSILEAISDAQISRQEASASAVKSIFPLVQALLTHLAPELIESGFCQKVVEAVANARRSDRDGQLHLRVSPGHRDNLHELFLERSMVADISEDESLSGYQAVIDWANGSDDINFDAFLSDLKSTLDDFEVLCEEDRDERRRNAG